MLLFSGMLYMLVRYASPSGPMCLRCLMLTLSRPVELLVVCSLSVFMCLFGLCVLCLTMLVNCWLNAFAICVGEVSVFSLKVMVLFLGCVGVLLASPCIVLLLLFAMIRSVVKSFKVPDVEVAAARMSNESALTRMTDSTPKKNLVRLDAGPGWMS